jgi:branched-chain amino acid transport system ATP-binding protein
MSRPRTWAGRARRTGPRVTDPILEIEGLEVRYGPVPAVRGIDLRVGRGEIVGVIGPNGAGKSSTLHAVMGAVPVHGGEVCLRGVAITGGRPEDIVRAGVALVPEGRHIFAGLTVEDNLNLGLVGRRAGNGHQVDLAWIGGLFPVVEEFRSRPAGALSGGQQQQLAIARALLAGPDVLLLDEPSLGLAPTVVETVWDALRQIRDRGVTIVLVEQRAQITVALADRTYVLTGGRVRATLTPSDAHDTARLVTAYFGS